MNEELNATLLVVDDDPDLLRVVKFYLTKQKFTVLTASDGNEALELMNKTPEVELVLSDVMMPGMNGLDLVKAIREKPEWRELPVLLISAEGESQKKVMGLSLGADDFLSKPFNFEELIARVKNHLRLRRLQKEVQLANEELKRKNEQFLEDLEAARGVQMALLPDQLPQNEAFEVSSRYKPLTQVGGDFFDVVMLDDAQKVGVLIADVCGHGIAAAFITAMTKITFRNACFESLEPGEVLTNMNKVLTSNLQGGFVTAFYAIFDLQTREMRYAGAGHPPLLWHQKASGNIVELESEATFLGFFHPVDFPQGAVTLASEDRLYFYTDGIYESCDANGEMYGRERFYELLKKLAVENLQVTLEKLESGVLDFVGQEALEDDLTLVGFELKI